MKLKFTINGNEIDPPEHGSKEIKIELTPLPFNWVVYSTFKKTSYGIFCNPCAGFINLKKGFVVYCKN